MAQDQHGQSQNIFGVVLRTTSLDSVLSKLHASSWGAYVRNTLAVAYGKERDDYGAASLRVETVYRGNYVLTIAYTICSAALRQHVLL